MRPERTNEVEERRIIRLLAGLAHDVPTLRDEEVERVIRAASAGGSPSRRVLSRRPARHFSAVAAAAAVAVAFLIQLDAPVQQSSSAASGSASIVTFAEGNALQLLLSAQETREP